MRVVVQTGLTILQDRVTRVHVGPWVPPKQNGILAAFLS